MPRAKCYAQGKQRYLTPLSDDVSIGKQPTKNAVQLGFGGIWIFLLKFPSGTPQKIDPILQK